MLMMRAQTVIVQEQAAGDTPLILLPHTSVCQQSVWGRVNCRCYLHQNQMPARQKVKVRY